MPNGANIKMRLSAKEKNNKKETILLLNNNHFHTL
jgi:hypothetical protein